MPRERKVPAGRFRLTSNEGNPEGVIGFLSHQVQSQGPNTKKKRRASTASSPAQASPSLPDLVPPPPLTAYGETIVASNPFDDTPPAASMQPKPLPVTSGKIYPPDQPMVFNPQNPNAPPIYPCGICHKEVHDNDQAILCESGCNFWFHRICTGLTEAAFHLLTAEVYAEWVCDRCLHMKNIPLIAFIT
uniref:PHD-type domain-containing protein n=1 Tax=Strigamia maritima TaxID=126957 RepID=T1J8P7_STRMM